MLTVEELHNFELEVFDLFKNRCITSPIHLRGGNEQILINIFKNIKPNDYCFLTWASHLECLLKGLPREEAMKKILAGKSICMSSKQHKILSSAIVGGNAPIAVGTALALKLKNSLDHVWCFIGDMTFYAGIVQESIRYAEVHDLPITFVIADNHISVKTPTKDYWGDSIKDLAIKSSKCLYYEYENSFPHAGIGGKVVF